jgi:hypothetical protein
VTYADAEGYKSGLDPDRSTFVSDCKTYGGGFAYNLAPGFAS